MSQNVKIIETEKASRPLGHYAQATHHAGVIYVSGQLGRGPDMSNEEAGDIEVQTRRCLGNILAIVDAAGSSADRLLKVNIYIVDIGLWPAVNKVYSEMLGSHRPARIVVPTPGLHYGALLEIDAIAAG
ncbi:MAG: reactive intermediate/imine deaminase [Alphaproteobacteria bacterium]|nr:MAG: reactive intermediate/imine deaminase [Alphaproteobacteria bacterium]